MNRKNIAFVVLIVLLAVLAVSWESQRRQIENYRFGQFVDFHETLIQLSGTLNNLAEVSKKNSSQELFEIIVTNELTHLESVMGRIRKIEARIDPEKTGFSKEYSIQKLLITIKEIEDITRDKGAAKLEQMFSNIAQRVGEVALSDTGQLTPQAVEELIIIIEKELEKARH